MSTLYECVIKDEFIGVSVSRSRWKTTKLNQTVHYSKNFFFIFMNAVREHVHRIRRYLRI